MTPPTLKQIIEKASKPTTATTMEEYEIALEATQGRQLLAARSSPSVMLAVLSALDNAYCTINNALEAERTSEAPITEQCRVFIDARKEILSALNLLNGKAP